MVSELTQFKSLFITLWHNTYGIKKTNDALDKKDKRKKFAAKFAAFIVGLFLGIYSAVMSVSMTIAAIPSGLEVDVLYTLLALSQFISLFFGALVVMNTVYFSNDNQLLSTLPITPKVVFSVKFLQAYISELAFSMIITLPMLIAYGVVCTIYATGIAWHFFLLAVISSVILPVMPLFIIALLSLPLMYLISYLKRTVMLKNVVMALVYMVAIGLYFAFVFGMSGMVTETADGGVVLNGAALSVITAVSKFTVYNYNLVSALVNVKTALNFFIYLAIVAALLVIAVVLSAAFYRRGILLLAENAAGGSNKKRAKKDKLEASTVGKTFFIKELRTLLATPTLLLSSIMSIVLPPVLLVFMSFSFGSFEGEEGVSSELLMTSFALFFGIMLIGSTNMIAAIGFSREGKHIQMLKTLPISPKTVMQSKLIFACIQTAISTLLIAIVYPIIGKITNPLPIIMMPIDILLGGASLNCMMLYNDLKNPNLRWSNINELTKNNKKSLKYSLPTMLIGFLVFIVGMILSFQTAIAPIWCYVILMGVVGLIPFIVIGIIFYTRLENEVDELFERMYNL